MPVGASTTITVSTSTTITETATATSTSTSTLTSTSTAFAPMATYYATCGSDNRVSSIDGRDIATGILVPAYVNIEYTIVATAYDCCVHCLLWETCGASYFSPVNSFCNAFKTARTCNPTAPVNEIVTGDPVFVASNGNCGRVVYNGR
jgi:hypothetical protein